MNSENGPDREPGEAPAEFWNLRLYVAGQTPKSVAAIANLRKICEEHLAGRYTIEVVDWRSSRSSPAGTRSWRSLPSSASFRSRCGGSSATCPTPSGCWSAWTCVPARRDRRSN